jgi:hypothetical protein
VGEQLMLDSAVPTATGVTTMRVPVVVRNVVERAAHEWRIGVEFVAVDDAAANALAEYCTIEPMWERLGVMPDRSVTEVRQASRFDEPQPPQGANLGRVAVRAIALFALVGAVASAIPTPAGAAPSDEHQLTGQVVAETAGVAGAVVTGVCSSDAGADQAWGTVDDHYSAPLSTVTDVGGAYRLDLHGDACWASVAPPVGYTLEAAGRPVPIDVSVHNTTLRTVLTRRAKPAPEPGTGSIGALVWTDADLDGVRDHRETGIGGASVTLFDHSGDVVARTVTDGDGGAHFDRLAAGTYVVGISNLPAGFVPTGRLPDASSVASGASVVTGRTRVITLADGGHEIADAMGVVQRASSSLAVGADPQILPAPGEAQTGHAPAPQGTLWWCVLVMAAWLALSMVAGSVRVRRLEVA